MPVTSLCPLFWPSFKQKSVKCLYSVKRIDDVYLSDYFLKLLCRHLVCLETVYALISLLL